MLKLLREGISVQLVWTGTTITATSNIFNILKAMGLLFQEHPEKSDPSL